MITEMYKCNISWDYIPSIPSNEKKISGIYNVNNAYDLYDFSFVRNDKTYIGFWGESKNEVRAAENEIMSILHGS